jgi:riboflavin synthase
MFTGIIESVGSIAALEPQGGDVRLHIEAPDGYLSDVALGDSVAVSGICLTVRETTAQGFKADLSVETLQATSSGAWTPGRRVNLEKALTPHKPLGGHLVSGHVDGRKRGPGACASRRRRAWPVTSRARARSPSTASASP